MTSKPSVSVLLPTRKRPEAALKSLQSLGVGNYEILVALDHNDPTINDYNLPDAEVVIMLQQGYLGLHHYYNRLASMSSGDWLLLWNDDALMMTEGWVELLAAYDPKEPVVLNPCQGQDILPIVSRAFYETLGHYSLSPLNDAWVVEIAEAANIHRQMGGIEVFHDNQFDDALNQEIGEMRREALDIHQSELIQQLKMADIAKLRGL